MNVERSIQQSNNSVLSDPFVALRNWIANKKIAVVGLGKSNIPLLRFLSRFTKEITAFDKRALEISNERLAFKAQGINFVFGEDYLDHLVGFDIIFKTPGIHPNIPAIQAELKRGATLSSEMDIFFDFCQAPIIGITGSDGKTTTTTLIHEILKEEGHKVWVGGNIGKPLIEELEDIASTDWVVVELSSFQLLTMTKSPSVSVITNITPNHLDVHPTMDEYVMAKRQIFENKVMVNRGNSLLILNHENDLTRGFGDTVLQLKCINREVRFFSRHKKERSMIFQENGWIHILDKGKAYPLLSVEDIRMRGQHNIENLMAAILAVKDFVSVSSIQKVARTFGGVMHRIEFVDEKAGVSIYNDSIASSPNRTIAGLKSFSQKVILIAGGCNKNLDYDELGKVLISHTKAVVLTGQTANLIKEALLKAVQETGMGDDVLICMEPDFEKAVEAAMHIAKRGDVVLLSPASTSFDRFANFEERGNFFKSIIKKF